ncbi:hypothetical protein L218DRAFT_720826 [Marasmius fiardii PR-910]|nr:hypothetical protein L218DRAFT_720826 [Marasmius fiardii PR-910]
MIDIVAPPPPMTRIGNSKIRSKLSHYKKKTPTATFTMSPIGINDSPITVNTTNAANDTDYSSQVPESMGSFNIAWAVVIGVLGVVCVAALSACWYRYWNKAYVVYPESNLNIRRRSGSNSSIGSDYTRRGSSSQVSARCNPKVSGGVLQTIQVDSTYARESPILVLLPVHPSPRALNR